MNSLQALFLDELADRYDSEIRLAKEMPNMVKASTCLDLQRLLQTHLKETEGHVKKLEKVFQGFGEKAKERKCEATVGLIKEGGEISSHFGGTPAIDAGLVSVAQKIEHYEIASYGCLHQWALLLGKQPEADLLQEILEEEKAANEALTNVANVVCNKQALGEVAGRAAGSGNARH